MPPKPGKMPIARPRKTPTHKKSKCSIDRTVIKAFVNISIMKSTYGHRKKSDLRNFHEAARSVLLDSKVRTSRYNVRLTIAESTFYRQHLN